MLKTYSFAALLALAGCGSHSNNLAAAPNAPATAAVLARQAQALTHDFQTWYNYDYYTVPLAAPYAPRDTAGQPLPRLEFLRQLTSGRYVVLRNGRADRLPVYQLVPCPGRKDELVRVSKQLAAQALEEAQREGQPLPAYHFTDLAGHTYTPADTKGKVLVIKCWFLACHACVEEFPVVNKLAARYAGPDVLFVSLVFDNAQATREFLQAKPLAYRTVPGSEWYLMNKLQVHLYPTHLVVGRDGRITYCSSSPTYLAPAIEAAIGPGHGVVAAR